VGIIDPLRSDVKEAVRIAQNAGVTVRMVTGDNLATACAIARQCGILTADGQAVEGPVFRNMTPAAVDAMLPNLQVMARSSPEDKYLLVTRLNGYAIPDGPEDWARKHKEPGVTWEKDRDRLMPGYLEEWKATRPEGGEVVGVTGDGTNDAPALKAADVGLAMGITGTKVAQSASDIVILDDKFSSIVRAIMWGRSVYDNIRKFLQFQLTVNIVALLVVFIGACGDFDPPLNAVMMLWINLVMDTMGALALATEVPKLTVLNRRPYKRSANLLSWPMIRNITMQSIFQLILLLVLLFKGASLFNVHEGEWCSKYKVSDDSTTKWDYNTNSVVPSQNGTISCNTFTAYCPDKDGDCYESKHCDPSDPSNCVTFSELDDFGSDCLTCKKFDWTHGTIIFNTFVFCQVFNEYNAKSIHSDWNIFSDMLTNHIFLGVTVVTIALQIMLVEVGGEFIKTSPLTISQWLITIGLALITFPIGVLMRFIPVEEDPDCFFDNGAGKTTAKPVVQSEHSSPLSHQHKSVAFDKL
jgi:magnesium-transporting ATPase (P-type)